MHHPRHRLFLSIVLFAAALFAAAAGARAQDAGAKAVPKFRVAPDIANLETPDWSLSRPDSSGKPDPHFYEKCMLRPDERLPASDQRALCACMDAYKTRIESAPKDEYWTNTIRTRHLTPYDTFVTHVFAPCMYLEAFTLGARECYRQSSYSNQFPNARAFDNYCTCYANAAEDYVRKYAEPLMAARMANPTASMLRHEPDPASLVMKDTDYTMYMYRERQRCTAIYGYRTNE